MNKIHILTAVAFVTLMGSVALANEPSGSRKHHGMWIEDKMDSNQDSMVSVDEWDKFHDMKFDEIDANNDGKISKAEFRAKRQAMMEKHKSRKAKQKSTSMPPANNEVNPSKESGGADGAGGWTAQ